MNCAFYILGAPDVVVEWRNQNVAQLCLPVCHALLTFDVFQCLGENAGSLHIVCLCRRYLRLEPVAIDAKSHIGVCNEPTIDAWTSAIIFMSLNLLQPVPRLFLSGKQRHLIG